MKHFLLLLLTFSCIQLSAQKVMPLSVENKLAALNPHNKQLNVLTIHVKNLPDSVKKVPVTYVLVQFGARYQATRYTETDGSGNAKITLDQGFPYQQIWLTIGDYFYAGVFVDKDLTVTLDVNKLPKDGGYMIGNGIEYSGTDGAFNTVMNQNVLYKKQEREDMMNKLRDVAFARKKTTPEAFTATIDSIRKALTRIDEEFIATHPNHSWAIKNETLSEFFGPICMAYYVDGMPPVYFEELKNHQPLLTSNDGVLFYRYLNHYSGWLNYKKEKSLSTKMKEIDSLFTPRKADIVKLMLLESEKDVFSQSYSSIISSLKNNWAKNVASSELVKATANQKKIDSLFAISTKIEDANIGKPLVKTPFNAELYHLDKIKNIDDFIRNLRAKFPGQVLMLDFWATWCAPCLSDLPNSKKLHEANKDLPIAYIYLCTSAGSNLETWKNKVADLQLPGTHIFVEDTLIAQLKIMLNTNSGYPSYVMIDAKGKVDSRSVTRMGTLNRESLKKVAGL